MYNLLIDSDEAFISATVDDVEVIVVAVGESSALAPADAGQAGGTRAAIRASWMLLPPLPPLVEKWDPAI